MAERPRRKLSRKDKKPALRKAFSVEDELESSRQLSEIDTTTTKSYVMEWLCSQPCSSPVIQASALTDDPLSFHDMYHHDLKKVPSSHGPGSCFTLFQSVSETLSEDDTFGNISDGETQGDSELFDGRPQPASPRPFPDTTDHPSLRVSAATGFNDYVKTIHSSQPDNSSKPTRGKVALVDGWVGSDEDHSNFSNREKKREPFGWDSLKDRGDHISFCSQDTVECDDETEKAKEAELSPGEIGVNPPSGGSFGGTRFTGRTRDKVSIATASDVPLNSEGKCERNPSLKVATLTLSVKGRRTKSQSNPTKTCSVLSISLLKTQMKRSMSPDDYHCPLESQAKPPPASASALGKHGGKTHDKGFGGALKGGCDKAERCRGHSVQESRGLRNVLERLNLHGLETVAEQKGQESEGDEVLAGGVIQLGDGEMEPVEEEPPKRTRSPTVARVVGQLEAADLSGTANKKQTSKLEAVECQPTNKARSLAEENKELEVSGSPLTLGKMTTDEVCKWLKDSGFETCVKHVRGEDHESDEEETSHDWSTVEITQTRKCEKDTDIVGSLIPLEEMTTDELCHWLIESGFEICVQRVKELGITGQHLANTDLKLFDQLQLPDADDRERLLFALYQELNPSNLEQMLGDTNIDDLLTSVELATEDGTRSLSSISKCLSDGSVLFQESVSKTKIHEIATLNPQMKKAQGDNLCTTEDIWAFYQPLHDAADGDVDSQMKCFSQRICELVHSLEISLLQTGQGIAGRTLRGLAEASMLEDYLNCVQKMITEGQQNIQEFEKQKSTIALSHRTPDKIVIQEPILQLHLLQKKLSLIQLKNEFFHVKAFLESDVQSTGQKRKKPLSALVSTPTLLVRLDFQMHSKDWDFTVEVDTTGLLLVTSCRGLGLAVGDKLIEVNGVSVLNCSEAVVDQILGESSTAQILVLRERFSDEPQGEACCLDSALAELTKLGSEFSASKMELEALQNEKKVLQVENERLRAKGSLLLQEKNEVLQSSNCLQQLLESSEHRWQFLKTQLEIMKSAFQMETKKLDEVEAKLKKEIGALKLKSFQDEEKIKNLTKALHFKSKEVEHLKEAEKHREQVVTPERKRWPQPLQELDNLEKQHLNSSLPPSTQVKLSPCLLWPDVQAPLHREEQARQEEQRKKVHPVQSLPNQAHRPDKEQSYCPSPKPTETPSTKPTHCPAPKPTQSLSPKPTQAPVSKAMPTPSTKPTQTSSIKPTQAPAPKPTQAPTPKATQSLSPKPTQAPASKAMQNPSTKPTQTSSIKPAQAPVPKPTQAPSPKPKQPPASKLTQAPAPKPTQVPAPKATQSSSTKPTQAPSPKPTQAPASKPTQAPASKPTQAPSPKPTQAPASKPTQAPASKSTQAPASKSTQNLDKNATPDLLKKPATNTDRKQQSEQQVHHSKQQRQQQNPPSPKYQPHHPDRARHRGQSPSAEPQTCHSRKETQQRAPDSQTLCAEAQRVAQKTDKCSQPPEPAHRLDVKKSSQQADQQKTASQRGKGYPVQFLEPKRQQEQQSRAEEHPLQVGLQTKQKACGGQVLPDSVQSVRRQHRKTAVRSSGKRGQLADNSTVFQSSSEGALASVSEQCPPNSKLEQQTMRSNISKIFTRCKKPPEQTSVKKNQLTHLIHMVASHAPLLLHLKVVHDGEQSPMGPKGMKN